MNRLKDQLPERTWEDLFSENIDETEEETDRTLDLVEIFNLNISSMSTRS